MARVPDATAGAVDDLVEAGVDEAVPVLRRVIVAPVTRTVRGIPTEVEFGTDEGLAEPCAASFDNLQPVNLHLLTSRVGALRPADAPRCAERCTRSRIWGCR